MLSRKIKQKPCALDLCEKTFPQFNSTQKHCSQSCAWIDNASKPVESLKFKTEGKLKRKAIKAKARKKPTVEQDKIHRALREMGCAVSLFVFNEPETPPDIHHITVSGRRLGHEFVIPLKPEFHRQGTKQYPSIHSVNGKHGGKVQFLKAYGLTEYDLLAKCEEHLGIEYSKGAA